MVERSERHPEQSPRYSRRQFLGGAGAAGVWAASGGLASILAACAADSAPSTTSSTIASATTTTAAAASTTTTAPTALDAIFSDLLPSLPQGGHIEIVLPEQVPDSLDQLVANLGVSRWASNPAHEHLEAFDHNKVLRPSVASTVEIVDDNTLRYVLHENVMFHNGRVLTSEDVKATIEWIQDPANASHRAGDVEGITIEVEDDLTFLLRMDEPNAGIRSQLTLIPIFPVETADQQGESPVGAGPFVFREWERGTYVEYDKNPDYWNDLAPPVDSLRMSFFADGTAGAQAFLSGQGDALTFIPPALIPDFQSREEAGEFNTVVHESGIVYVAFNHESDPYGDARVRRAIALTVDREEIAAIPSAGLARPAWFLGLLPEDELYPAGLEYERDLDAARDLLAEAGYPDGFSGTLLSSDLDLLQGSAVVVQSQLQEVGINLELEVVDLNTIIDRMFSTGDFSIAVLGDAVHPEPTLFADKYLISGDYLTNYNNPEVDELIAEGARTLDVEARKEVYRELFQIGFVEDVVMLPLTTEPFLHAYRTTTNYEDYRPKPNRWSFPIVSNSA